MFQKIDGLYYSFCWQSLRIWHHANCQMDTIMQMASTNMSCHMAILTKASLKMIHVFINIYCLGETLNAELCSVVIVMCRCPEIQAMLYYDNCFRFSRPIISNRYDKSNTVFPVYTTHGRRNYIGQANNHDDSKWKDIIRTYQGTSIEQSLYRLKIIYMNTYFCINTLSTLSLPFDLPNLRTYLL